MKSFIAISTLLAGASANKIFASLNEDERTDLEARLAKWKTLYGPIAQANGFTPESLNMESHSEMELLRFHETTLQVQEAAKNNPLATFSEFNQFALLNDQEFQQVLVKSFGNQTLSGPPIVPEGTQVGAGDMDWSTNKCNPPVRNQGQCGSCWAFSTVGTVEAAHCIATGELLDLSEQQVVSCSTNGGSMGCNGGFPPSAIDWMQQGVCMETDWPYTQQTGTCNKNCQKKTLSIGKTVQTSGESSLQSALNQQPVTVVVEAGNSVWRNYKSGVVTQCPGARSDHAVIAVGYGTSTGNYFKIKNSWGPQWGDNGYMYLQRGVGGKGMCNVAEGISYPALNGSPGPKPSTSSPTPSSNSPTRKPLPTSPSTRKPLPTGPSTRKPLPTGPSTRKPLPTGPSTRKPLPTGPSTRKPLPTGPNTQKPLPTGPNTHKPLPTGPNTRKPLPTAPSTRKPLPTAPTPSSANPTPSTRKPLPTAPTPSPSDDDDCDDDDDDDDNDNGGDDDDCDDDN